MGYESVGKVWDQASFKTFLETQDLSWAKFVCIHHTSTPSLAQRPKGFTIQHMRNLEHYYKNKLGWSAGPHLFIDDDQIFGLSSLERRGVHAKSFNATSIGIEVLGDYDNESNESGRGLECWKTAAGAVSALLARTGWTENSIQFHRDDPKTSKTCPGKKITKKWFLSLLGDHKSDRTSSDGHATALKQIIDSIEWQVGKLKKLL